MTGPKTWAWLRVVRPDNTRVFRCFRSDAEDARDYLLREGSGWERVDMTFSEEEALGWGVNIEPFERKLVEEMIALWYDTEECRECRRKRGIRPIKEGKINFGEFLGGIR